MMKVSTQLIRYQQKMQGQKLLPSYVAKTKTDTYVALEISDATPNNGKMLLLKSGQHSNYFDGYCYENSSVKGNEQHKDCFIPTYISISGNTIIWLEYNSEAVHNEGAAGTSCFANYSTALNYLPYSKGSWFITEYSKNASSNLQYWTLVE